MLFFHYYTFLWLYHLPIIFYFAFINTKLPEFIAIYVFRLLDCYALCIFWVDIIIQTDTDIISFELLAIRFGVLFIRAVLTLGVLYKIYLAGGLYTFTEIMMYYTTAVNTYIAKGPWFTPYLLILRFVICNIYWNCTSCNR
eukprot:UN04613